jgi:pimeloyl-ACP methyl ester carboxylesterase
MTPPETRYARSGDLRIAYQVVGSGPLDLVFVPGFGSNVDLFWEMPEWAGFFRGFQHFPG